MYYMMYYESKGIIKSLCKGVTIKHLTGNVLNTIPFALPPLPEQYRIVTAIVNHIHTTRLNIRILVIINTSRSPNERERLARR